MSSFKIGYRAQNHLFRILFYVVNTLVAVIFVSPLVWMVVSSLKPENQIFTNLNSLAAFWPVNASLDNYVSVFERIPMWKYMLNTFFYVGIILLFDLILNSMCGYALAKLEFKGKRFFIGLIISLMVIPTETIILPLYVQVNSYHWINTWAALIVPFIAKCFSIYMFRQFFLDIPNDLIEAASIDGSGAFRTFFTVVVPISGTVYATVFILDFVAHWNDFMWPLLLTNEMTRTVQLAIQVFFGDPPGYYGPIMAALTLSAIPMIIRFIFMQKYYVQGIASTGIKG